METEIITFDDLVMLAVAALCAMSAIVICRVYMLPIWEAASRSVGVDHLAAKLLHCGAVVQGLNNERLLPAQKSAKQLLGRGETLRALRKFPRIAAQGWRADGCLYWCDVVVASSVVHITLA